MEENKNLYQITKTIRFKLIPQQDIYNPYKNKKKEAKDVSFLILKLEETLSLLKDILYAKDKKGTFILKGDNTNKWNNDIKIKYTWMRNYLKTAFYANKDENDLKHYKLADLKYVQQEFDKRWFVEMQEIVEGLKDFQKKAEYEKQRDAQVALIINRLTKRNNFGFIKTFVLSLCVTNKPETDKLIDNLKKSINEFEIELNKEKENFLPSQSNGVQFAAGSFNYYTVNKSPKMLDSNLKNEKEKLKGKIYHIANGKYLELKPKYRKYNNIIKDLDLKKELKKIKSLEEMSLEEVYASLKKWKAEKKKEFMEALQVKDYEKAKTIKLFEASDEHYNEIKKRILSIQELANKLNNSKLSTEQKKEYENKLKEIKQKKNDFFNTFTSNPQTKNYKALCEFYRKIAQERGNSIAKIAAIEKDKNFAEQMGYWCIIIEKENHKFLYMIPRDEQDSMKKSKDYISKLENKTDGKTKLHYFNSLTLRALRKLCFKETDNTFKKTLQGKVDFPQYEQQWKDDVKKQIKFYQEVLKKQNTLDLTSFEDVSVLCEKQFESMDEFESGINKICYAKTVCISDDIEQKLKKDFNAVCFEITSQDIEHNLKYFNDGYRNKNYTEIWNSFWANKNEADNFSLRLNPEIKIMWRCPKSSRIIKYGEGSNLYDTNKKNRYLYEQYSLVTTVTDNAHNIKINLAFKDTKDKGEAIMEFNKNYTVDKFQYAMGIDVGTVDLACLSITDKGNNPQLFDVYEIREDKFGFSKTGFFKDGTQREKPYKLIQNPSYFLNAALYQKTFKEREDDFNKTFEKLFEKKQVSGLDLTTAKVICGKIILNGDFITHQNLKILNAKRKISRALKQNPNIKLDILKDNEHKLGLFDEKGNEFQTKKTIYQSIEKYKSIKPYENIKKDLLEFVKDQRLDDARLEDNINKTRASLVANMVGVISFLYASFPGFIVLENLKQSIIESHREEFEGDITRPLEWALYRKFQSKCLVPPISELIKLREEEKFEIKNNRQLTYQNILQFGVIKFVEEKETSLLCPKCEKKAYVNSEDPLYIEDKNNRVFQCKNCGFHNRNNAGEFGSLDTNDKIAAFNIAKRGFKQNT